MGCGGSRQDVGNTTFQLAESEIKLHLKQELAKANPLSRTQLCEKLKGNLNMRDLKEWCMRAVPGSFAREEGGDTGIADSFLRVVEFLLTCRDPDEDGVKEIMESMLSKGADCNYSGEQGVAAIHFVAHHSSHQHAAQLLKILAQNTTCDLNLKSHADGETAAHELGRRANETLLDILIKSGRCDLQIRNNGGHTAQQMLEVGRTRVLAERVANAKAVCIKAASGDSTLNIERAIAFLRSAHAEGKCTDVLNAPLDEFDGVTILGLAAKQGNLPKTFSSLLTSCDPNLRDASGKLPEDHLVGRPVEYVNQIKTLLLNARGEIR